MAFYPLFLNLKDRAVLVVGAGQVALQKLTALLDSEARIHVVAPEALAEIKALATQGRLIWSERAYDFKDLEHVMLVVAATDDHELHEQISQECRAQKILLNCAEDPQLGDSYTASIVKRGQVQIAISTGGRAPALSKLIRQKLESVLGSEYADLALLMDRLRPAMQTLSPEKRAALTERLGADEFLSRLRLNGLDVISPEITQWIKEKDAC